MIILSLSTTNSIDQLFQMFLSNMTPNKVQTVEEQLAQGNLFAKG